MPCFLGALDSVVSDPGVDMDKTCICTHKNGSNSMGHEINVIIHKINT